MIRVFKRTFIALVICGVVGITACTEKSEKTGSTQTTICNPMNLSYRFQLDSPSRREAAWTGYPG